MQTAAEQRMTAPEVKPELGPVLWHITMSVDGFIAGPGDDMSWMLPYIAPNPDAAAAIASVGSVLAGRRSYDVGRSGNVDARQRKVYGGAFDGPIFVLTHRPPDDDAETTFLTGDISAAVRRAQTAGDGRALLIIGAEVAAQCLQAGLIEEIVIHVAPVLLGDGVRLFGPDRPSIGLEPISVNQAGAVVNLRFRVVAK
jgi:dihydrofolate reductase